MENNIPAVLVAQFMKRRLDDFLKANKAELEKEMSPGDSKSARYDLGGQEIPLGKITRTEPRPGWKITDPDALLEWAKENAPELTETVTVLSEKRVADLMKKINEQNVAATDDGELIPGVTWDNSGGSYVRLTPAKDMGEKLSLLSREGHLVGLTDGLLGIES